MASAVDVTQLFGDFSRTIQLFAKDESYHYVTELVNQNEELSKANEELVSMNNGITKAVAQLHKKVEEAEKVTTQSLGDLGRCQSDIQALDEKHTVVLGQVGTLTQQLEEKGILALDIERKVDEKQNLILELEQKLSRASLNYRNASTAQKGLQDRFDALEKISDKMKTSLDEYTALTSEVIEMSQSEILEKLDVIMSLVRSLVVSYFGVNLEAGLLAKVPTTPLARSKHMIPLLNSNSAEAKCMRIAASMNVVAEALEKHIFQSTYLLPDNGLCQILLDLAEQDADREAHLRAVLLPVRPQDEVVKQRIDSCVKEVENLIGPMISPSEKRNFKRALREACTQICNDWAAFQRLRHRIEVSFNPFDAEERYLLLAYLQEDIRQAQQSSGSSVNATDGKNVEKKGIHSIDQSLVGPVIWPTFRWMTPDGPKTIQNCVVLSLDQVSRARSEHGPHRDKRTANRKENASATSSERNNGEKSFLSGKSAKLNGS